MDKYDKNGDGKFGREEVRTMLAQIGGHRQRPRKAKPQWQFAEDDEEEDTDEEEEGEEEDTDEEEEERQEEEQHTAAPTQAEKPIVAPPTRALMGETIEEGDEDLSTVVSACAMTSQSVDWCTLQACPSSWKTTALRVTVASPPSSFAATAPASAGTSASAFSAYALLPSAVAKTRSLSPTK